MNVQLSANDKKRLRRYFQDRPIHRAYVFGSYARKGATRRSDVDILVELDHSEPIGLKFFRFQLELESLLKKKVDLVSAEGLSRHLKPLIDLEKVLIYEKGAD